ncbi:MAG: GNAT family N-acetyltransferase [Clostridia bacterium]|nr:GNAT family N-acetyltransferase [Clostridia bacterium]
MLSQILELHAKFRPDLFRTGATKYSKEEILDIIGDPGRRSYVAADGNGVVLGYALCQLREQPGSRVALPYTSLYVDDLCVDETCRGRSVGRKLFEAAKAEAKALGCYELNLVVWEGNDRARAFYDKMGMKPKETMMELIL